MTVRKLYIYPDPPLKQKITNSDVSVENVKDEVKDLIDTLKHYEGNFYITSNHIGLTKRIAVIDLQAVYKKEFPETDRFLVMVNPEIVEYSNEIVELQEGSISTPDFVAMNKKSRSVKVKFDKVVLKLQDQSESNSVIEESKSEDVTVINTKLDFEQFDFQTDIITIWEGLAYVVQAAVSQLDGKCYLDNVSWYNRESYLKKRRKTVKKFQNWVKNSLMGINTTSKNKRYKFAK